MTEAASSAFTPSPPSFGRPGQRIALIALTMLTAPMVSCIMVTAPGSALVQTPATLTARATARLFKAFCAVLAAFTNHALTGAGVRDLAAATSEIDP